MERLPERTPIDRHQFYLSLPAHRLLNQRGAGKVETGGCRGREEALGNHGAPLGISSDASKGRPLLLVSFPVEYGLIKSFKIKSVFGDSEERPIL